MSQENVEIVRQLYNEFLSKPNRMFDSAVLGFFDPDVEIRQSASLVGTGGTFHGYEDIERSARELFEVFRDLYFVPLRLFDSGDHVVATVEAHAYGKDSGAEVNEEVGHVWKLREGRVVAWHVYWDPSQALEAVGLSE
jgi:ketosteroid isomerase-like protein